MEKSRKGFALVLSLVITLLVVGLVGLLAFGVYSWQHNKVSDLSNQLKNYSLRITGLDDQISILSNQLSKACQTNPTSSAICANYNYISSKGVSIMVFTPTKDSLITSPVIIIGQVPGNWSYEAQFPITLKALDGTILAKTNALMLGDWQTTKLVPFSAKLSFNKANYSSGSLILEKDNPSGLSKNSDYLIIPVKF